MITFLIIVIVVLVIGLIYAIAYYKHELEHLTMLYETVDSWHKYLFHYQMESKKMFTLYKKLCNEPMLKEDGERVRNEIKKYETDLANYL